MQTMVICVAVSTGGGGVRYIAVSLPLIACLLDGKKYMLPVDPKPPQDQPEERLLRD
jgi:hypothetical protein